MESKLRLLQKALENNKVIMNSLKKTARQRAKKYAKECDENYE